jgi:hypothetical protein
VQGRKLFGCYVGPGLSLNIRCDQLLGVLEQHAFEGVAKPLDSAQRSNADRNREYNKQKLPRRGVEIAPGDFDGSSEKHSENFHRPAG